MITYPVTKINVLVVVKKTQPPITSQYVFNTMSAARAFIEGHNSECYLKQGEMPTSGNIPILPDKALSTYKRYEMESYYYGVQTASQNIGYIKVINT